MHGVHVTCGLSGGGSNVPTDVQGTDYATDDMSPHTTLSTIV